MTQNEESALSFYLFEFPPKVRQEGKLLRLNRDQWISVKEVLQIEVFEYNCLKMLSSLKYTK